MAFKDFAALYLNRYSVLIFINNCEDGYNLKGARKKL